MIAIRRVLAAAAGVAFGIIGAVGLIEAGATDLDRHVDAAGFHQTGLLAWIQLVYGVLLIGAAVSWGAGATTGFLGAIAAVFGFVVLIAGGGLHDDLGVHAENGTLFLVAGAFVALFGFLTLGRDTADSAGSLRVIPF